MTTNENTWDEWAALSELPEYDDQSGALFASRNKNFWGLFKRIWEYSSPPEYLVN